MIELKPEYFTRTGSSSNDTPIYKIHLQRIDDDEVTALDIMKQVGGKEEAEQYFAEFETGDLPALCEQIEKIANGECDEKD